MMNSETKRKLLLMNCAALADAIEAMEANSIQFMDMTDTDKLTWAVDMAYSTKLNEKIRKLKKHAHFRYPEASIKMIDCKNKKFEKALLLKVCSLTFLTSPCNVIITGFCGSGKTYLGNAIGNEACNQELKVSYIRFPELLEANKEHQALNHNNKFIEKLVNHDVLIIDEWMLSDVDHQDAMFLFELCEKTYQHTALILITQVKPEDWYKKIAAVCVNTYAEGLLERIIYNSVVLDTGEKSIRKDIETQKVTDILK